MKKGAVIALSSLYGVITAFVIPALLIALNKTAVAAWLWQPLLGGYLAAAGLLEPFVWRLLPWPQLIPGGGAPGAFAITGICILLFWGVLFSITWFLLLRRSRI